MQLCDELERCKSLIVIELDNGTDDLLWLDDPNLPHELGASSMEAAIMHALVAKHGKLICTPHAFSFSWHRVICAAYMPICIC